jgi:heme-degrading monooxygenase HmoA
MFNIEAASSSAPVTVPGNGRCPFRKALGTIRAVFTPTAPSTPSPFVSLSKFVVGNDKIAEVKEAFRQRPHLVDGQTGFVRMEVISPIDRPEEIWLITYWTDAESFRRWHRSHLYQESHKGIPKGLKLVPGQTEMRQFEHICS